MTKRKNADQRGFTLIELLVAITMAGIILGAITMTFKSQHDSSLVQEQVTAMQQNLRAAMFMITRDVQMAGYYTNFDTATYDMDWDDGDGDNDPATGTENIQPLIFGKDNVNDGGGDNITDHSDVIVIVKASDEGRAMDPGESADGNTISLADLDLDNDGDDDFDFPARGYGLLVKQDLSAADFFRINAITGSTLTTRAALAETYEPGDRIFRADVIIYRVDNEDDPGNPDDNDDPTNPKLRRKNLGQNSGFQPVAEGIDQLQFRYLLHSGVWVSDPAGNEANVRAVEVFLLARTHGPVKGYWDDNTYAMDNGPYNNNPPNDPYRRKLLSSIIRTRNIGL